MGFSFNGIDILSVAPFEIMDVIVSAPSVNESRIRLAAGNRSILTDYQLQQRTIIITGDVKEDDIQRRQEWVASLLAWATAAQEAALIIPQEGRGYFLATCTSFPDMSALEWWSELVFVFTASEPYYRSLADKQIALPNNVQAQGSTSPIIRIEQMVATTLSLPAWYANGGMIQLASVTPGKLVIDFEKQSITLNGTSIQAALSIDSRFWTLAPGINAVTCANGAGGTLFYTERWL